MGEDRRLLKYKYGGSPANEESKKTFVKFEKERGDGDYDIFTFECDDEPHPDLVKALEAMAPHLRENCEIDDSRKVTVKSVTCTHKQMEGFEVHGLVISGLRELRNCNSPMSLNSPHKTDIPYADDQDADDMNLTSECLDDLAVLEREVFAYVDGKRAQLELGLEEPPKENHAA